MVCKMYWSGKTVVAPVFGLLILLVVKPASGYCNNTCTLKFFNQHALRAKYMWVHWHRSFPPAELFCCNTMPSLVRSRQFIPLVTPPVLIEQLRVTLEFGSTVIWFTRHSLDREQDSLISQSGLELFAADTSVEWKKLNNIWKFCQKKILN